MARRSGNTYGEVQAIYDAMVEEAEEILRAGNRLLLKNIGSFYVQLHKGHSVSFGEGDKRISDYPVVKFSSSSILSKRIREEK